MPPPVLKLSRSGSREMSNAAGRNASHVRYVATHGARAANAAHVVYQATHDALHDSAGHRLIGAAAGVGEAAAIAEAQSHDGHQWRWVLSLRGDDAGRLGYHTADDWHRLAREVVPGLAAAIGIRPEALRWVAAHHDPAPGPGQVRHPHLHIALWSSDPLPRPHRLSMDELRQARRAVTRAIYGPERARLGERKTALREAIRRAGADSLRDALAVARALKDRITLPPGPLSELGQKLEVLAALMPGHGRAALAYMPQEIKQAARDIADYVILQDELVPYLDEYRATARAMAAMYTEDPAKLAGAELRAYNDLRDRVAQAAVRAGAELQRQQERSAAPSTRRHVAIQAARGLMRAVSRALQAPPPQRDPAEMRRRTRKQDGRGRDH